MREVNAPLMDEDFNKYPDDFICDDWEKEK